MVPHEYVGVHGDAVLGHGFTQQVIEVVAIKVVYKDCAAVDASLSNMERATWKFEAGATWHAASLVLDGWSCSKGVDRTTVGYRLDIASLNFLHPLIVVPLSSEGAGGSASHSIPKNTPSSMKQYFEKSDPQSMANAAIAIMDYFHIDHAGVHCCDIAMGKATRAEMWPDGKLEIGETLFSNSFGMIGATLYHEVGVHWDLQFSKPDVVLGSNQAWSMREVQAYNLEIKNASRFGLTPAEVNKLRDARSYNLKNLNSWNRSSVENGIYIP